MSNQKRVQVYRHPPKESGESKSVVGLSMPLSKEGREMAKKLAEQFLTDNGEPQMIVTSACVRTYQAGMIFAEVCDVSLPSIEPGLLGRYQEWERLIGLVPEKPTVLDFYKVDPRFMRQEAESVLRVIRILANRLKLGENAVCFGHGGLIEPTIVLAQARICGKRFTDLAETFPEDLYEGEAVVFVFDNDNNLVTVERQDG